MDPKKEPEFFSRKTNILRRETILQAFSTLIGATAFLLLLAMIFEFEPGLIARESLPAVAVLVFMSLSTGLAAHYLRSQWVAIEKKSGHDPVSGIMTRIHFEKMLEEELRRGGRYHYSITLCYIDLDNFGSYTEHFGRTQGDKLLKQFAQLLQGGVRFADCVARYQNDEFCVLLPHTDIVRAEKFLTRIQAQTQERLDFGFSAGVTSYQSGENKAQFVMRALAALNQAKHEGRKKIRYVVGDSPTTVSF